MAFYRGDVDRTLQASGHLQNLFFVRTQFVLQIADLAAQRGLCDQQFCCCTCEVQFFRNGDEISDMTKFHVCSFLYKKDACFYGAIKYE